MVITSGWGAMYHSLKETKQGREILEGDVKDWLLRGKISAEQNCEKKESPQYTQRPLFFLIDFQGWPTWSRTKTIFHACDSCVCVWPPLWQVVKGQRSRGETVSNLQKDRSVSSLAMPPVLPAVRAPAVTDGKNASKHLKAGSKH